ncbi:MAG: pilus assembly protein N-terminal domain-containing protein [Firmicutes bacterium]|nr:pilus assembly protein N-terminal domain-containing protein [Bacillota bacterium]
MISAYPHCGRRRAGLWVLALVAAAVATLVIATASAAASEAAGAQQVQQAQVQVQEQAQQVQQSGAVTANRAFAVVVGESRILQVNGLVRVAIADPAIADVVVVSKTEVIVNGKAEGRTTLHVWDASGRSSYDVRVCVDNADLIREIEETIGISGVRARFARSTLLLDGSVETDADSERAERIAKAYADKVLNLLTVRRPTLPPPPPVVEASEVQAAIGVKGVSVRVLKDAVILEGQVESLLDSDRAEKIARIFTNHVLNFIVVNPPLPVAGEGEEGKGEAVAVAPADGEPRPGEPGVQKPAAAGAGAGAGAEAGGVAQGAVTGAVGEAGAAAGAESVPGEAGTGSGQSGQAPAAAPETMTFSPQLEAQARAAGGEAAGDAEATPGAESGAPEKSDPDAVLRNTIVAAVRDPAVEVTVVKGTVLLEGLVSSDYAKLRAETVARLYAPNVVSILRVAEPPPTPPTPPAPAPAPSLPASPPSAPEPRLEDKVSAYINMPTVKVRSVDGKLLLEGSVASQNELERVGKIAAMFSNDVVNLVEMTCPVQVLLQVNVIEVNRSSLKNLGVTWGGVSGERIEPGSFLFGEVNFPPLPPLPTDLGTWDAWRKLIPHGSPVEEIWRLSPIRAVLDLLVNEDAAKVLAAPSLLTLSGKQADFLVGGEIPIYVGRSDGKIAFEWRPYGIKLTMLPTVDTRGRIAIDVQPEVSSLDWNNALDVGDAVIPALKVRRASTHLVVADGTTIAIGGLLQNTDVKIAKKVPILGDIPIIGSLFKSEKFERGETELVILITPKVVRAGEAVTRDMMVKPALPPAPALAPSASGRPGK